jgi:hypothetical protein
VEVDLYAGIIARFADQATFQVPVGQQFQRLEGESVGAVLNAKVDEIFAYLPGDLGQAA